MHLFFTVLGAGEFKIKALADPVATECLLHGSRSLPSPHGGRG